VTGLETRSARWGSIEVAWAANPRAPVDTARHEEWRVLLVGEAGDGGRRLDARGLAERLAGDPVGVPPALDGFHALVAALGDHEVLIAADLLGLFPVFYAAFPDVLLAATTPAFFSAHPLFDATPEPEGIVTTLLMGGPYDGRCLLRGARRLSPGRVVRWKRGHVSDLGQYTPPPVDRLASRSFDQHAEHYHHTMQEVVRRAAAPAERCAMLLSGGRDSRLIAAYLAAQHTPVEALTFGVETDHEALGARAAARSLGFAIRVDELPFAEYVAFADATARWQQVSGMSSLHTWGAIDLLRAGPPRVVTGHLRELREVARLPDDADGMLAWSWQRGVPPPELRRLAGTGPLGEAVDDVLAAARARYAAMEQDGPGRAWRWRMMTNARFHEGGVPWRLSFASWPVLPVLDRALLEMLMDIPTESLADRRLVDAVFLRYFPRLARLPLDRNALHATPIAPSLAWRLARRLRARLPRRSTPGIERRFFWRVYDLNNAGWRAIRRAAEPGRAPLGTLLSADALAAYLPPPDAPITLGNPVFDAYGRKLVLGLMLWAQRYVR
jgi:asparagine synthase (glutamine-hydrolysing)